MMGCSGQVFLATAF